MKIQTLVAAVALALSGAAFAQTTPVPQNSMATPGIDARQANQDKRIDQGIASGSLTKAETARLEAEQARNIKAEDRMKADGKLTKKERARLHHRENRSSEDIFKQKHDRQHDLNHDGVKDGKKKG
ncbi:MAG: hypothetical protein RIS34_450 [Pseudomonadota bacterium]|jgi:opacity protein-like surface antigen